MTLKIMSLRFMKSMIPIVPQLVKERSFYVYLYPWSSCYYSLASQLPITKNQKIESQKLRSQPLKGYSLSQPCREGRLYFLFTAHPPSLSKRGSFFFSPGEYFFYSAAPPKLRPFHQITALYANPAKSPPHRIKKEQPSFDSYPFILS